MMKECSRYVAYCDSTETAFVSEGAEVNKTKDC